MMLANIVKDLQFTHLALRHAHNRRRRKYSGFDHLVGLNKNDEHLSIIDKKLGYALIDASDLQVIGKAIRCAKSLYCPEMVKKAYKARGKNGPFYVSKCDHNDQASKPIFDLAMDECILAPVRRYLDATPVIVAVEVWFSPNDMEKVDFNSQLFHFDREDYQQIKCFVPIHDIDETCGPMTLVPKEATRHFVKALWKRGKIPSTKARFEDALVERFASGKSLRLCGKAGSIIFADTTQCLHYGSRAAKKPKYHLAFQYLTPYSPKLDGVRDDILRDLENRPRFVSALSFKE